MKKCGLFAVGLGALGLASLPGAASAETFLVDLTHPLPTFGAMEGDPMKPDLANPWLDSKPVPTFGQQTVLTIGEFPIPAGHFDLGTLVLSEHHGTHMDTSAHFVNKPETLEDGNPPASERELAHQTDANDLIGRIVLIDISGRVQSELDKNGGKPSSDPAVTDFRNDSGNVVTADDVAAVADQIDNGVWVVISTGWSRYYFEGIDWGKDPYINNWNFPGLSHAGVDKLIDIENQKGVRINGIVADVIGVESGESSKGSDDQWSDSWPAHVRGMQRGWKLVENATNLGALAQASGGCTMVVGAPKHVRGSGGPSRVLAICER